MSRKRIKKRIEQDTVQLTNCLSLVTCGFVFDGGTAFAIGTDAPQKLLNPTGVRNASQRKQELTKYETHISNKR